MTTSTTPTDAYLIKHCIRTLQRSDKVVVEVEMLSWPHSDRPASEWTQC